MAKRANKLKTWVVRCGDNGSMLYKVVDGFAKVCRYKTKTAALRDCSTFVSKVAYRPKFVLRAKVRAEEEVLNYRRNSKHARAVRAMEDQVVKAAAARLREARKRPGKAKKNPT